MKAGTRIAFDGKKDDPNYVGTVLRWHPISGKREDIPGYQRVRFDVDSGPILVHESRLVAL
jgi:hypothetical protein